MAETGNLTPLPVERRAAAFEVRTSGRRLAGYAATFGAEAVIGRVRETIAPGAFAGSLAGDVLALLDHDPAKVLGRTRSGSLRLSEDSRGLAFDLDLPDTQAGSDVLALAQRGDLGGMSFGFVVPAGGDSWDGERRTLNRVELREISVVSAWPAYPDTSLALRSMPGLADRDRRRRIIRLAEVMKWA
jgi:HK97 family phage prohead protease